MKKKLTGTAAILLLSLTLTAQGVSKLFGLVGGSPQPSQASNGFLFSTDSSGQGFQVQYDFPVTTFGANPQNLEMMPYNGKLYGTTSTGGVNNFGTIFEYDPATDIYTKKFDFGPNATATGGSPKGSLLWYNNKFYGLTADYGASGAGCIFEWDPATNVYTKRYDIPGGAGGANPQNSLRLMNGKMYGTTSGGGSSGIGVVFEWDPASNIYTKLTDFNGIGAGTTGWSSYSNVTAYNNKIYAGTTRGGQNDYGTILMIDPSLPVGANTIVAKHLDASSGGNANNNEMIVYNNKLYGFMYGGGVNSAGTLFELDPAGNVFTKLVDFNYTPTGGNPQGKLVLNGTKFIAMCSIGGVNGTGTIFEWDPANPTVVTKKYDFLPNNFDNTVNPGSTFGVLNSKFYATSYNGGFVNQGNLFEYDYAANTVTKKKTFNAAENGRIPLGKPVLLNGKLYGVCYQGPQEIFGTPYGCLWSFDPSTGVYSRKILFDYPGNAIKGRAPVSAPVAYNGKLYGTTTSGGVSDLGVLYEYDPATETYTKKDMQTIAGSYPVGEPVVYNNKLYGMTNANGNGNAGIVYSYDIATGVLNKLYDVQSSGSQGPNAAFTLYNNKLYGTTASGGANGAGGVFVYDPATNTASTVASFAASQGFNISNAPTLYNNKFYMMAYSGGATRGSILQFDPATNTLTNIYNFTTTAGGTGYDPTGGFTVNGNFLYAIMREPNIVKVIQLDPLTNTVTIRSSYTPDNNFNMPNTHNGLTVVPAFIANGLPNSCENYTSVVINATNNNQWVPILNNNGDVVAEIKANGNNLGTVTSGTYINNGAVREDASKQLYADRSITLNVQTQPSTPVDIRLYLKTSEFLALKNGLNSLGQPSGITSISDIAILKNSDPCGSAMTATATRLTTGYQNYEYGYVLTASVSSFSTFYFAKNTYTVLPVHLLSFAATKCNSNICLLWTAENEENFSHYELEKLGSNNSFARIARVNTLNTGSRNSYIFTDVNPFSTDNYYRLKMVDLDGTFTYSKVIRVGFDKSTQVALQPNPANDFVVVKGVDGFTHLSIIDVSGRIVYQRNIRSAIEEVDISKLSKGIYTIQLQNTNSKLSKQFIKQ